MTIGTTYDTLLLEGTIVEINHPRFASRGPYKIIKTNPKKYKVVDQQGNKVNCPHSLATKSEREFVEDRAEVTHEFGVYDLAQWAPGKAPSSADPGEVLVLKGFGEEPGSFRVGIVGSKGRYWKGSIHASRLVPYTLG